MLLLLLFVSSKHRVFGGLANTDNIGFSFVVNVLPIIIFFSALMSVLYRLRIMEWVVKLVGGFLHRVIGTGAVESMNAAANIFVGQTEAPLVVRPYLKGLTEAQMFTVMVSGLASIASTVLAAYSMLAGEEPALTSTGRPLSGLGAMKASCMDQ